MKELRNSFMHYSCVVIILFNVYFYKVLGQFPPRNIAPQIIAPSMIAPRTIAIEENCRVTIKFPP